MRPAILAIAVAVSMLAFTPPASVPYTAAAYADRAKLRNFTGATSLAAYASPAACPAQVNLFSQNVGYSVPVLSLPGRAGLGLPLTLAYNSKVWIKSGSTIYFDGDQGWPGVGWRLGFGRIDGVYSGPDGFNHYYHIAPDGAVHDLRYNSGTGLYESRDSTWMDFNESTGVLRMKDGTQITYAAVGGFVQPTQVKDRNGNYITINYTGTGQQISSIVDTLGRTTTFTYNDGTLSTITKTGFAGAARTWTFGYTNITLTYNFGSLTVNGPSSGSQVKVLSSLTYPNGAKQVFSYNAYAQLTEAQLQSSSSNVRGKFLIAWQPTPGGGWADSPTPASLGHFDGTSTNNWSLAFNTYSTTVTDPTSVPRTTTFLQTGAWDDGLPSQTQIGSPVLRTLLNEWEMTAAQANPGIMRVTTTLNDSGQQSKVEYDYGAFGNVVGALEYDYGFVLKRKTITNYVTASNYTNRHILNLPANVTVYEGFNDAKSRTEYTYDGAALGFVSGASNHDDTNYGTGFVYRGLVTTVTRYTNAAVPSGAITNTRTYDMLGNLRTESADCCVQKVYNFSSETQHSQPDSIVRGSGATLTTSSTYDSHTSLLASSTDENNKTTTYSYDVMDRTTTVTRSDGTQITTTYDDASATASAATTTPIEAGKSVKQTTELDGQGRTKRGITTDEDDVVYSKVDTLYDSVGRTSKVSNPYTGASASFWTETQYDAIGRPTKVIPPDGTPTANHIAYSYSGNATTVTDQTGRQRKFKTDALGRQIEVTEPDPANNNSLTLVTSYIYDPMDNLTQITQGSQTRSYVFDGLSRKTSETTPEAGTVSYTYNSDNLMTTRTDARGVVTTYSYDTALNRLISISYNVSCCTSTVPSTPTVSYTYGTSAASNNNGRLIEMTDGPGEENYSYDSLGRTTQVQKIINPVTYTTSYTYNLASNVVTTTYPSGFAVKQEYDAIGRLQAVKNNATGASFVSGATYNAANQLTGFSYGNGVSASYGYSADRQQLVSLTETRAGTPLLDLDYGYSQSGNNNGQIAGLTDTVDAGRSATYTYDSLHRIKTAVTAGSAQSPQWGLAMSYDRYGNRTAQTVTHGTGPSHSASVNAATNHFTGGYSYDASGNMTADGVASMVYDAEARMTQSTVAGAATAYSFDGNGLRVKRVKGATTTVYLFAGSQVLAEYENGALEREYVYFGSQRVALWLESALANYLHHDHLSIRLMTNQLGDVVGTQGHFPYGEGWYSTGATTERLFTSYDHDDASADDYAIHRFHNCRLGRFRTADPVQAGDSNPQELNRYAYVTNNPVAYSDPTGEFIASPWPYPYCLPFVGFGLPGDDLLNPPYCRSGRRGPQTREELCGVGVPGIFCQGSFASAFLQGFCRGTTNCTYYDNRCHDLKDNTAKYLLLLGPVSYGEHLTYYCVAAPPVCRNAGNNTFSNCVRLCLQRENCFGRVFGFPSCQVRLHEGCFVRCAPCVLV